MLRRMIALSLLTAGGLFAQDLTGTWQGTVRNPDTQQELRTVIKIASSDGDPIKANFWSIDQTYLVFPATLTLKGTTIKMNIPGIGAVYDAKLTADGSTMSGTVKGFSVPAPWILKRVSATEEWAIPKPPVPTRPMAADADPAFEVATIKPSKPDEQGRGARVEGVSISVLNRTLTELMTLAYDVHPHQMIGMPAWSTTQRFDITGKADVEGQPNLDQLKIMLRKLLADRFQLAFHKEQKELPLYSLSLARGGSKISKNDPKNATQGIISRGPGSVLFNNVTMDDFARMLQSSAVDRPVLNQTGLQGKFDFSLVWTPDQGQAPVAVPNALAGLEKTDAPPDIFTAMQQQLGLRLEAAKLPIEVFMVDKVERPSDN